MVSDHDLLLRIDEKTDHIVKVVEDHEQRLRPLEAQQHRWLGRDGAIAAGVSLATALLVVLFSRLMGLL
ncbi:MAG: hypothetical protein WC277_08220 [Bacilli bacterium]